MTIRNAGHPADPSAASIPRLRLALSVLWIATSLLLSACGGGGGGGGTSTGTGGGSGASMSVSTHNIAVNATMGLPAPTATFSIDVSGAQNGQQFYLSGQYSKQGIDSLTETSDSFPATLTLQFRDPASLAAGTYNDTVQVSICLDQACKQPIGNSPQSVAVMYTVVASIVTVISLLPSSAVASGPGFMLTVDGTNFGPQATVVWNGSARPTNVDTSTQLTAQITAADIAAAGSVPVTVSDPTNGASGPISFTIKPFVLALGSISPASVTVGGPPYMLTILGGGFSTTSTVQWNGSPRPTTFVSTAELVVQIGATDIATIGTAQVTVNDPASAVGTTAAQTLVIAPASKDAVALQMNSAHTGAVTFASVSLPLASTWSVDVGGVPSYALIAQGNVYVTVTTDPAVSSQIVALDQATGATVWGPLAIAGNANAAYDAGRVFVLSASQTGASYVEALDAGTGQFIWSSVISLASTNGGASAVTAADGLVFTTGTAFDQRTGIVIWNGGVVGADATPAVTADGVYFTVPCYTADFRPATGEMIWNNNQNCSGGGGATAVVANQMLYAPNGFATYNGSVFNAESGANAGTYIADNPGAFTSTMGYFLQSGTLRGILLNDNTAQWSFTGDGKLITSPIVVNQYVFIGSSAGNLYALDGVTGQQDWQVTLNGSLPPGAVWASSPPLSGLAAGDGLLVVPSGTRVTGYTLSSNP